MAGTIFFRLTAFTLLLIIQQQAMAQDAAYLGRKYMREANELYNKGEFAQAAEKYQKAIESDPTAIRGSYNLGNALYRQKMYKEAGSVFESSVAQIKDPLMRAKANHNLGNVHMQNNEFQKAVDAYKRALKDNPDDEDTRYNLAYAMQKLKQQQQQQNKNDQNKDNQEKENKENKDEQNKDKEKEDQQNKENQDNKQDQENKEKNQQNNEHKDKEGNQKGEPKPNQLSKEQAKKILEALNGNEKKLQEKLNKNKDKAVIVGIEKDW